MSGAIGGGVGRTAGCSQFLTRPGYKGVGGDEGERIRNTVDGSGVCGGVSEERRWLWGGCDSVHEYRGSGRDAEEFEGDGF